MMKRIRNLIPVILWLTVLLAAVSCGRQGAVSEKLDVAESLMNARPDSVLAVLQGIPASAVKGKKASARYALLSSMALDKNYIDTTTFDILQPAIDYYTQHGTPPTSNSGPTIIKAGFIRIRAMMTPPCVHS